MKIALPYVQIHNEHLTDDNFDIIGGLEKHIHTIYKNFNCVAFHVNKKELKQYNLIKKRFAAFVAKEKPDIIYSNYPNKSFMIDNIPNLQHWHMIVTGGFMFMNLVHGYWANRDIKYAGVSNYQEDTYTKLSQRLYNKDINFDYILFPDYYKCAHTPKQPEFDICSISRLDVNKNPLLSATKFDNSGLSGKLFTTELETEIKRLRSDAEIAKVRKYYEKNRPDNLEHIQGLHHKDIMSNLAKARVFHSTCSVESFGITVLEALSRGVPCILSTKGDNTHASEVVTPNKNYIRLIDYRAPADEYISAFNELKVLDRNVIAQETKEMHSKSSWKKSYDQAFNETINNHTGMTSIEDFLG